MSTDVICYNYNVLSCLLFEEPSSKIIHVLCNDNYITTKCIKLNCLNEDIVVRVFVGVKPISTYLYCKFLPKKYAVGTQ